MSEADNSAFIYCNACKGNTRHLLVAKKVYDSHSRVDDGDPAEWGEYRLWTCAGCDTCTMEDDYTADYMVSSNGHQFNTSTFYPKRLGSHRSAKHFVKLPSKLRILYSEVVASNNEGLHLLCAAGLRTLLEGVCADKGIEGSNLEKKIEGMKSLLPESVVNNLHEFRFIGNRALHDLEAPESNELSTALDVIEDILNFLYALDCKANLLRQLRAARVGAPQLKPTVGPSDKTKS